MNAMRLQHEILLQTFTEHQASSTKQIQTSPIKSTEKHPELRLRARSSIPPSETRVTLHQCKNGFQHGHGHSPLPSRCCQLIRSRILQEHAYAVHGREVQASWSEGYVNLLSSITSSTLASSSRPLRSLSFLGLMKRRQFAFAKWRLA